MNVFELIKEKLEEETDCPNCSMYCADANMCGFNEMRKQAISIVNEVQKEYNNGWIPCSERLPELRQDCLVIVKYSGFMGMYGTWIKTGHMEAENDWWGDCSGGTVIAWQPLPAPYKEGGTE